MGIYAGWEATSLHAHIYTSQQFQVATHFLLKNKKVLCIYLFKRLKTKTKKKGGEKAVGQCCSFSRLLTPNPSHLFSFPPLALNRAALSVLPAHIHSPDGLNRMDH